LLNKITPTTYPDLSDEFIKYGVHNDEILLERVVGLIFEKAVEEPHFCSLYSDICKKQCDHELGSQQVKAKTFRQGIINRCQSTFAPSSEKIAELEKKITEDSDEKLKASILEEIELVKSKEKRRLLGIIK
jgi:translation initiation factor 4G